MARMPDLGLTLSGIAVLNFDAECGRARDEGSAMAAEPDGSLDRCPYDEQQDPILRAIWQDAFVTARLYRGA
jgi:hypothetical protein